ncbi:MAG: hypothetical protein AMS19_13095 [Gemmatimonas sp. SG8_23]|nr:MAG: hypothetical protein AMS19_13095 [Gemmatimonas sp. SG8_23]
MDEVRTRIEWLPVIKWHTGRARASPWPTARASYLLMLFLEDDDGRTLTGFVSRSIGDDNLSADLRLVRR